MRSLPRLAVLTACSVAAWCVDAEPVALAFAPSYVRVVQDYRDKRPGKLDQDTVRLRAFRDPYGRTTAGCEVGVDIMIPDGWKLVTVRPAVLIEATTDGGETLSAQELDSQLSPMMSRMTRRDNTSVVFGRSAAQRQMGMTNDAPVLRMSPLTKPATKLSTLIGSVDVIYGEQAALKHFDFKVAPGETAQVTDITGCDLSFTCNEANEITVEYSPSCIDMVQAVDYLTADNKVCGSPNVTTSGMNQKRRSLKLNFGQEKPAAIAVDCLTALKAVKATFSLKDVPLVVGPVDEVRKPIPAKSVVEIAVPPLDVTPPPMAPPGMPPAGPMPTPPAGPPAQNPAPAPETPAPPPETPPKKKKGK